MILKLQLANENSATAAQNIVKDVETYCQNLTGDGSTLVNYASSDLKLAVVCTESQLYFSQFDFDKALFVELLDIKFDTDKSIQIDGPIKAWSF